MNSKLSKSRVIHARATATPNAINTRLRRHQIGYKARSNASIGFMTKSRSELDMAQLVAWGHFGEPSGYSHRVLTPAHALRNARAAIGIPLPETEEDEPCNA